MDLTLAPVMAIAVFMFAGWLLSLALRDASIVDIGWGLGFALVAVTGWLAADAPGAWQTLTALMTAVWGLRLAGYLAWRNLGHGEDPRYQAMRRHWGPRFPLVSLVTVFALQGVLMWIVSLPVQVVVNQAATSVPVIAWPGVALWAFGLAFESIGDLQLARFKADPNNAGAVMDQGLWAWTRHPNYFGDACVWWGLGIVALGAGIAGVVALVGPLLMTVLLVRVSGKALLERSIGKRRPGYAEYVRRTSGFIPRPPAA